MSSAVRLTIWMCHELSAPSVVKRALLQAPKVVPALVLTAHASSLVAGTKKYVSYSRADRQTLRVKALACLLLGSSLQSATLVSLHRGCIAVLLRFRASRPALSFVLFPESNAQDLQHWAMKAPSWPQAANVATQK